MAFSKLERFEAKVREARERELEELKRRELRKAVRDAIPKNARMPKRPRGRTAVGGLSRKEVAALRAEAAKQLDGGEEGLAALEAEVQRNTLVILKIDGVLGTEPWRAAGGPHAGIIAANARLRYVENAIRILEDLRRSRGRQADPNKRLLEGVIDAEVMPPKPKSVE